MFIDALKLFLEGKPLSEEHETVLLEEVKKIVYFALKGIDVFILEKTFFEKMDEIQIEILQETLMNLFDKRFNVMKNFEENSNGIKSYIKATAKNIALNRIRKKRIIEVDSEKAIENEKTYSNIMVYLEAKEFSNVLNMETTKNEKYALCCYLLKENMKNKSRDSLDKAISRLKIKISRIAKRGKFSYEAAAFALNNFIVSEICEKDVNNK